MKHRILSTKRLRPSLRNYLLNAGFSVVDADFIQICRLEPEIDNIGDSLIFTSSNAVRSLLEHPQIQNLRSRDCFCVGEKTRSLLISNGFTVTAWAHYAVELLPKIKDFRHRKFTFFSGNLRLETLPVSLRIAGIKFDEIKTYVTRLSPIEVTGKFDAVLFFSPSGVESFLSANKMNEAVGICIGETTAKPLQGLGAQIILAAKPSIENVIIRCIRHFETSAID